ncbi:MAG: arsenate reductase ArsC [Flavobacteriales bacterium]
MRILVLCTGNSCRSQMAHGYLQHLLGNGHEVYSAGIEMHGVNQHAIATMHEDGIDISHHTSNHLDEYRDMAFDHVITVCDNAREACPWFPTNAEHHHHSFPDPAKVTGTAEEVSAAFRKTREEIKEYCRRFVADRP